MERECSILSTHAHREHTAAGGQLSISLQLEMRHPRHNRELGHEYRRVASDESTWEKR